MKTFTEYINESGFSRVRRMLWGNVLSINSVGVITAENPDGSTPTLDGTKQQNAEINKKLNKKLFDYLKSANYGPIQIKGSFGQVENPYIVPNISRDNLIDLGIRFKQQVVIWGSKQEGDNPAFKFEYIEKDTTTQTRDIHVANDDIQSRDDFYSAVKGRKFIIPFFDDPYSGYKPGEKYGTIKPESFNYYEEEFKGNSEAIEIIKEIRQREYNLQIPNKTLKYYWEQRGHIRLAKKKLDKNFDSNA
jgi:hypothetical protein